jgi:hypothetical protein
VWYRLHLAIIKYIFVTASSWNDLYFSAGIGTISAFQPSALYCNLACLVAMDTYIGAIAENVAWIGVIRCCCCHCSLAAAAVFDQGASKITVTTSTKVGTKVARKPTEEIYLSCHLQSMNGMPHATACRRCRQMQCTGHEDGSHAKQRSIPDTRRFNCFWFSNLDSRPIMRIAGMANQLSKLPYYSAGSSTGT